MAIRLDCNPLCGVERQTTLKKLGQVPPAAVTASARQLRLVTKAEP